MIDNMEIDRKRIVKGISKAELARLLNFKSVKTLDARFNSSDWKFNEVWLLTQILDCEMEDLIKKGARA